MRAVSDVAPKRLTVTDMKRCNQCGETKIGSEFPSQGRSKATGERRLSSACRECRRRDSRTRYAANRDERLRYAAEYRDRNRESILVKKRQGEIARKYGITPDAHAAMVAAQGGACLICGGAGGMSHMISTLVVDHDHSTGAIRGLLCAGCNIGIGLFKDDPNLILAAAAYLARQRDVLISEAS